MKGRRAATTIYLSPDVLEALRLLSHKRDQAVAALIREAVEDLLYKYSQHPATRGRVQGRPVSRVRLARTKKA